MRLRRLPSPLNNLINSEGTILEILQELETGALYACGLTAPGNSKIYTRVNSFTLELYLKGRITLQELFLLRADEHYLIKSHSSDHVNAIFFDDRDEVEAAEITHLSTGTKYYPLLPGNMRPDESIADLIALLPPMADQADEAEISEIYVIDSPFPIFHSDTDPLRIVNIASEELNEDDHSFMRATSYSRGEKIFVRINDMALKLFLQGRLSVKELFLLRTDDKYFSQNKAGMKYSGYTKNIMNILSDLGYGNLTYFNLPSDCQVDSPLSFWVHFRNYMINGKGVLPFGFTQKYPVDLSIR